MINVKWTKDRYLPLDGSVAMSGNLNLNNNKITKLAQPTSNNEAANKNYVGNQLFNYVKTDGSSSMVGSLDVNDHRITGLSLHPPTGDEVTNKEYVDAQIKKSNIKPKQTWVLELYNKTC